MSRSDKVNNVAYYGTFTPPEMHKRLALAVRAQNNQPPSMIITSIGLTVIVAYSNSLEVRLYHLDSAEACLPYMQSIAKRGLTEGNAVYWFTLDMAGESLLRNFVDAETKGLLKQRKPRGVDAQFINPRAMEFDPRKAIPVQEVSTSDDLLSALGITDSPAKAPPPQAIAPASAPSFKEEALPPHRRAKVTLRSPDSYIASLL